MFFFPKHQLLIKSSLRKILIIFCSGTLTHMCVAGVHAYDVDTHFWLTYYLARKAGYTALQAQQIAGANLSVDYDKDTSPLIPATIHPQDVRARFHSLPSSKEADKCESRARNKKPVLTEDEARVEIEKCIQPFLDDAKKALWKKSLENGNPGVYLHFFQDSYSHRGFTSRAGHFFSGHFPDYLSSDPGKAKKMVDGTIEELRRFMQEYLKPPVMPPAPDSTQLADVLMKLINANQAQRAVSPNAIKARDIVKAALDNEGIEIWTYDLEEDGNPDKEMSTKRRIYLGDNPVLFIVPDRPDLTPIPWKLTLSGSLQSPAISFSWHASPNALQAR